MRSSAQSRRKLFEPRACRTCSSLFTPNSSFHFICSDECRSAPVWRRPKVVSSCSDCGSSIVGTAARRRCDECNKRTAKSVRKHRQRAAKFGGVCEVVSPIQVFERDGWRCQLCGIKTPKRLRGTYKPTAPELDHIIPLSLGGSHTYQNTQCACRACNGAKGAKPLGQLRLIA